MYWSWPEPIARFRPLPPSAFQLLQGRANIPLVHDRVALEDAGSLPSCDAHDDFLRYAGSPQVPCRSPAQVVEEKGRYSGGSAQILPALAEVTYWLITSREHVILRPLALHAVAEQLEQWTRLDCDLTSFPVLGCARVKPDGAGHEIHLTDAKIEQFAYPPTVVVGSFEHRPEPQVRAVGDESRKLLGCDKALSYVVFPEVREIWNARHPRRGREVGEPEHAFQACQLAIDRALLACSSRRLSM